MGGEAPRADGLEHVVVEHEVLRVGPVVRDLASVVVTHHVGSRGWAAVRVVDPDHAAPRGDLGLSDEPVHLAPVDVGARVLGAVRATAVDERRIVVRAHALARAHVARADGRHAVTAGDPVGAGERAEVAVKRAVLLHDHDEVPDLVDPGREPRLRFAVRLLPAVGRRLGVRVLAAREHRAEHHREHDADREQTRARLVALGGGSPPAPRAHRLAQPLYLCLMPAGYPTRSKDNLSPNDRVAYDRLARRRCGLPSSRSCALRGRGLGCASRSSVARWR